MSDTIDQILYTKHNARFQKLEDVSREFSAVYSGNPMIRDGVFEVVQNYSRKNAIPVELLRYPFHDDELWAASFLKKGVIFVCINSGLPFCKQFFAVAHELYHIYCFGEENDQSSIRGGSILSEAVVDDAGNDLEELEANAFAGLLLMPKQALREQIDILGINPKKISLDDILVLMETFAVPYKACVLRLYECGITSASKAREFLDLEWKDVQSRMSITGKAKRWQLNGKGTEVFGTLFDNFVFNADQDFLTDNRVESDRAYISFLKERFGLDMEGI